MSTKPVPRGVAIEGGSIPAMYAYPPVLQVLDQAIPGGLSGPPELQRVFAGASMGAVYSAGLAMGAPVHRLAEIAQSVAPSTVLGGRLAKLWAPLRLFLCGGLFSTRNAESLLASAFAEFGFEGARLGDLPRPLAVQVVLEHGRGELRLSSWEHPKVPVLSAVLASMAIPMVFDPVQVPEIAGSALWCSDGGLTGNHPISTLSQLGISPSETLGIRIDEASEIEDQGERRLQRVPRHRPWVLTRALGLLRSTRVVANASHVSEDYWHQSMVQVVVQTAGWFDFSPSMGAAESYRGAGAAAVREAVVKWGWP